MQLAKTSTTNKKANRKLAGTLKIANELFQKYFDN